MKARRSRSELLSRVAAIVGACDGRSPTSPEIRCAHATVYSLTGIVTEPVGVPVEGATVTVTDGPHKGKSSATDGAGHYALIGVEGGFTVQVDQGRVYVRDEAGHGSADAGTLDVEITPLVISGNISGNWTVTFEPARCPSPLNVDARKYRASIVQQGAELTIALSGATFATPPQLTGTIHDLNVSIDLPSGCDFYCYYGPTSPARRRREHRRQSVSGDLGADNGDGRPILDYWNAERRLRVDETARHRLSTLSRRARMRIIV